LIDKRVSRNFNTGFPGHTYDCSVL
jgi:hypothetical protein